MAISSSVQDKVKRFDPALRLVERRGNDPLTGGETMMIAVERRDASGVYRTIGWVRPDLLGDGSGLLAKLKRNDVREYGSGAKAANAYDESERHERDRRKAERKETMEEIGKAAYETHYLRRAGSRISNAGIPGSLALVLVLIWSLLASAAPDDPIKTTVASLPTSGPEGMARIVVDGLTEGDCTSGGGRFVNVCLWTGTYWSAPQKYAGGSSGVPSSGFLPFNPTSSTVTASGCKISLAGGNMGSSVNGANFLMSCDEGDKTGRFIWVMQNDEPNHPRSLFEVRRDGFTRANGIDVAPSDPGFPGWNTRTPYGGVGGQMPTSRMLMIASDLVDANGSALQVYGTLRNVYSSGSNNPALMTLFGYANSNGGGGLQGVKRFEVTDAGATTLNGLPVPTLSCVAGGALGAATYYVRYSINMPVESLLSPPFVNISCGANTLLKVTAPPVGIGQSWNVYVGNSGPATERLQATGSGLSLGSDWTEPIGGLSGSTIAPMYVQHALQTLMGGYACTGSPSICATLYIGGKPNGGTTNAELVMPTLKSTTGTRFLCIDTNGVVTSSASACSGT